MMDPPEMEGIAEAIAIAGRDDGDAPPRLHELVTSILGHDAIDVVEGLGTDAEIANVRGQWRVYLRPRLPLEQLRFALAHELAEWWLCAHVRYQGQDVEHVANYIGAAILVPRRALRRATAILGRDVIEIAKAFGVSQTLTALREAEVDEIPRAVVTPSTVRVRGPAEWVWPGASTLRQWATAPPARVVRRTMLTDAPRRAVLDADPRTM